MISENIKKYIDNKGFNVNFFEKEIGASSGMIRKAIKNNTDIQSKWLASISDNFPDLNLNWLITGKGKMLIDTQDNQEEIIQPKSYRMPKVVTVDNNEHDNIVLVPQKASAGYLSSYNDPEFIKQLPSYRMPNINNGTYRMFQLDGHSMHPTMQDSSYVVCEWVENWEEDIKDDRVYVVVSIDDGVVIKRVLNRLNKYGSLYCKSDNRREYHNFAVKKESIKEVWHVKMHMTFEIPNPVSLYERMNDLEAELEHIKSLNIELRQ